LAPLTDRELSPQVDIVVVAFEVVVSAEVHCRARAAVRAETRRATATRAAQILMICY
jgi:hypothetical protein